MIQQEQIVSANKS